MHRPRVFHLLAIGTALAGCGFPTPAPTSTAEPSALMTPSASTSAELPPPYDLDGVLAELNRRSTIAAIPTAEERTRVGIPFEAFVEQAPAIVERAYPGERARVVSVNLLVIDIHDSRFQIDHRLAYVVETTGQPNGNCFTMFDAATADQFLASCFHGDRSRP